MLAGMPSASDEQLASDLADLLTESATDGRHRNKHAVIVIVYNNDQMFHFIRFVDDDSSGSSNSETSSSLLLDEDGFVIPKQKSAHTLENEVTQERMLQLRENMDRAATLKKGAKNVGAIPSSQFQNVAQPSSNSLLNASSILIPIVSKRTKGDVISSAHSSKQSLEGKSGQTSPISMNSRPDKYITKVVETSTTAVIRKSPGSQSPQASTTPGQRSPHRPNPGTASPLRPLSDSPNSVRPIQIVQPVVVRSSTSANVSAAMQDASKTPAQESKTETFKMNSNPSGSKLRAKNRTDVQLTSEKRGKVSSDPVANGTRLPRLSGEGGEEGWRIESTSSIRMSLTNALSTTINARLSGGSGGAPNLVGSNFLLISSSEPLVPLTGRQLSAATLARSFNDIILSTNELGHTSLEKINLSNPNRCSVCRKKTGLTTSFLCRCGGTYCAIHRYPEEHACTVDYKAEGRKTIAHDNPIVKAPKLPKI